MSTKNSPVNNVGIEASCDCSPKQQTDWFLGICLGVSTISVAIHILAPDIAGSGAVAAFVDSLVHFLSKMWWGIAFGVLALGLLSKVPREWIRAALGKGILPAIGAGLLFDLCSHGILLIGAKLYERGATLGQTLAFLIASPWNSFSVTLILIALIGLKWTAIFIALSAVIALGTGWLADALTRHGHLPENPNRSNLPQGFSLRAEIRSHWAERPPATLRGFGNILRDGVVAARPLVRWLLFGAILAALIQVFVPTDVFTRYFGPTVAGLALTMLATSLIEVCSEGSSPIAADLLGRAEAPGNAFAFLMAGVATDATELMVLRQTTGRWVTALAMPILSLPQVILFGWLLNLTAK